jgi:hypothetical protein
METRARYALIGLFMLAVILASFAFIYWLENKGGFGKQDIYQVRFQGSVSGLEVGSEVLFNGLRVGDVTKVSLSADRPQDVVATIAVVHNTPVRDDTEVTVETQGLTGGATIALTGGTSSSPLPASENGTPPMLLAAPDAGQDWTQAARDAFQRMDQVLTENSESLNSAIKNIDTFAGALARNSDKVDGILAGIERLTGGGTAPVQGREPRRAAEHLGRSEYPDDGRRGYTPLIVLYWAADIDVMTAGFHDYHRKVNWLEDHWESYFNPEARRSITSATRMVYAKARNGYTHQWRRFPEFQALCMASCDTEADHNEAKASGWRTFRVRLAYEPLARREIACPASKESGFKTTCADCRACGGLLAKAKADIAIVAHGPTARRFELYRNGQAVNA